jgi:hypothetical protein
MKVFVVTAYRWGSNENHSYVVGVYSTMERAKKAGDLEESYRGGKYSCHILDVELDYMSADEDWGI